MSNPNPYPEQPPNPDQQTEAGQQIQAGQHQAEQQSQSERQTPEAAGGALPGIPVSAPSDANQSEASGQDAQWRRLHRVTPLLNAWKVGVAVFAVAIWNSGEYMSALREAFPAFAILGMIVGLLIVGFLIGLAFSFLGWRRTQYGVSAESVFLHKGVISRQQRHVRLDRIQAVEVTQPLLARIFGFASVKVESAGGSEANLTFAFLTEPQAQALRNELLARAAGVKFGTSAGAAPGDPNYTGGPGSVAAGAPGAPQAHGGAAGDGPSVAAPVAPEREIAALTPGRLIGSLALSISVLLMVLALIGFAITAFALGNTGIFAGSVAPIIGAATYFYTRLAGEFAFRVAISPDGIRIRQGLLETKARTLPPGRVQAVRISQPLLWRIKGWWRIQVNVAGYAAEDLTGTVLYPVATREEVAYLLSLVVPDLGDERPLEVLHAGMDGSGDAEGFTHTPRRARWIDPITWRRNGFRVTDTAILMRTGRLWRGLAVVPHERTQSLGITQGPIERAMNLAGFVVHSTPGPVVPQLHHLDIGQARALLEEQSDRAQRARHRAGPERWMSQSEESHAQQASEEDAEVDWTQLSSGVLPGRVIRTAGILPGRGMYHEHTD